jgi:phage shock protein E
MAKMLPTLLVVAVVLAVAYFMFMKGGDVSSAEARQLVQAGARLVDVRTPDEFAAGHIPGAVNIPVQQLDARMSELEPKDVAVVVYCRSGHRTRLRRRENDVHVSTAERVKVSAALLRTPLLGDGRIDFGGQVAEHRRRVGCGGAKLQDPLCANKLERFDHGHDGQMLRRFPKLALVFGLLRTEQRAGELDERVAETTFGGVSPAAGHRARGLNGAHVTRHEQRPYLGVARTPRRGKWGALVRRSRKTDVTAAEGARSRVIEVTSTCRE